MSTDYREFIKTKTQLANAGGFEPVWMPDFLFDFQKTLVDWSVHMGRSAIFADCGMGKTPMQLVWAQNVVKKTNRPVLLATPLAVGQQALNEACKFGIEAERTRGGVISGEPKVYITNYEQLHHYDPSMFSGFVGDESSCVKDAKTERKKTVTEFTRNIPYRLLCTATAAPNDFVELGTSSEILGNLGFRDMITKFFKMEQAGGHRAWGRTKYRFRGHAQEPFWQWVTSWARSVRLPSDLGGDDSRFILPELREKEIEIQSSTLRAGELFAVPARNMQEEREERRRTLPERCERAAEIASDCDGPFALWVTLNDEADTLERTISNCKQVSGSMSDDEKEEILTAFSEGELQRIVIKPKIGAWGLNWQHCSDIAVFPSHSYEQYYQLVRRCYRFGQTKPVDVSIVVSEGESGIISSLKRKQQQADEMFCRLVAHMKDSLEIIRDDKFPNKEEMPQWV